MDSQEAIEAKENDERCAQDEYTWVQSLIWSYGSSVVDQGKYFLQSADDGQAWVLMLKAGAKIVPGYVYSGGMMGFVFMFRDDMTPRPFNE